MHRVKFWRNASVTRTPLKGFKRTLYMSREGLGGRAPHSITGVREALVPRPPYTFKLFITLFHAFLEDIKPKI